MRWIRRLFAAFAPLTDALRSIGRGGFLNILRAPVRWLTIGFWMIVRWCAGLNLRLLLQGLPALIVGGASVVLLSSALFTPSAEIETRYLERADVMSKAKSFTEALTCYERLARLRSDRPDVMYDMATTLDASGAREKALVLMRQLATTEKQGYAKAHLWLGVYLLTAPHRTAQTAFEAEGHLMRALNGGVENAEVASGLLGELCLQRREYDRAEIHLTNAAKKNVRVRLRLAHLYHLQGRRANAEAEARAVAIHFSNIAGLDLYAHEARIHWAHALTLLSEHAKAIRVLEQGFTGTRDSIYRAALAQSYAAWFDQLGREGSATTADRLQILELGLGWDPKSLPVLERLLAVAAMRHMPLASPTLTASTIGQASNPLDVIASWNAHAATEQERARAALKRLGTDGPGTAELHFVLGLDAFTRGDQKEAQVHWEQAFKLNPASSAIANNLAFLLMHGDPKELPKAFEFVNLALVNSNDPNYRDTRGRILLKMAQTQERKADARKLLEQAKDDLLLALPVSRDPADLHEALAEINGRLERPTTAAEHRKRVTELRSKKADLSR